MINTIGIGWVYGSPSDENPMVVIDSDKFGFSFSMIPGCGYGFQNSFLNDEDAEKCYEALDKISEMAQTIRNLYETALNADAINLPHKDISM